MKLDGYVTVGEAAELLGVTPGRVSAMVRDEVFTDVVSVGRTKLIPRDQVEARCKNTPKAGRPKKN